MYTKILILYVQRERTQKLILGLPQQEVGPRSAGPRLSDKLQPLSIEVGQWLQDHPRCYTGCNGQHHTSPAHAPPESAAMRWPLAPPKLQVLNRLKSVRSQHQLPPGVCKRMITVRQTGLEASSGRPIRSLVRRGIGRLGGANLRPLICILQSTGEFGKCTVPSQYTSEFVRWCRRSERFVTLHVLDTCTHTHKINWIRAILPKKYRCAPLYVMCKLTL